MKWFFQSIDANTNMSETISQLWPWNRSLLSFRKGFHHSEETICIIWPKKNYKQAVISCLSRNYLLPFFTFLVVYVGFLSVIATTKQHFFNSEDHFCEYVHHEHRHGSTSTHMAVKKCQHRQSVGRQPPPHNHWWRLLEVYVHTNNSMLLI